MDGDKGKVSTRWLLHYLHIGLTPHELLFRDICSLSHLRFALVRMLPVNMLVL
jgi:hypothetical protein